MTAWQLTMLQAMLAHANENVPFYRNLWRQAGVDPRQVKCLDDLVAFPITTKAMLLAAGDEARDQTQPASSLTRNFSSGSTGRQLPYYVNREHHSWFLASGLLGFSWTGWEIGDRWMRVQFRRRLNLRETIEDYCFRCLYMPIDQLDSGFLDGFLPKAIAFKPKMVRGNPGVIYVIARHLLERGEKRLRPRSVVCTGDMLWPHYRQAIEEAFGAPVFDNYGGEGISAAAQCACGTKHILPPVIAEFQSQGLVVDSNDLCRTILTSLTNTAMPMIRYDIGDVAVPGAEPCACGRAWPVLKNLIGRQTDIVVTPSGRHVVCHHFGNFLRRVNGLLQFQILQERKESVLLRMETDSRFDRVVAEAKIRSDLEGLLGPDVELRMEYVPSIPSLPSGKRRYVISKVGFGGDSR